MPRAKVIRRLLNLAHVNSETLSIHQPYDHAAARRYAAQTAFDRTVQNPLHWWPRLTCRRGVTILRSSAGCLPDSRANRTPLSIVCRTSSCDTCLENPKCTPASIGTFHHQKRMLDQWPGKALPYQPFSSSTYNSRPSAPKIVFSWLPSPSF